MKIEQTKMWSEFLDWHYARFSHKPIFQDLPFEYTEGIYRAFLREKFKYEINVQDNFKGEYIAVCLKYIELDCGDVIYEIHGKTSPEAFMNLVTEIFNQSK